MDKHVPYSLSSTGNYALVDIIAPVAKTKRDKRTREIFKALQRFYNNFEVKNTFRIFKYQRHLMMNHPVTRGGKNLPVVFYHSAPWKEAVGL